MKSSDLRRALKEVKPGESVWAAATRIGINVWGEKDGRAAPAPSVMRIRSASNQDAVERTYKKSIDTDKSWSQCPSCWKKLVRLCFLEYGPRCSVCGAGESVTAHHIIPRSNHGPNEVWNLIPLCEACHNYVECLDPLPTNRGAVITEGRKRLYV